MSHRTRAENRAYKARKDPKQKAFKTKVHGVKTSRAEEEELVDKETLDEIDEFFAEYAEPDPYSDPILDDYVGFVVDPYTGDLVEEDY